jgi:hypothetical protein
MLIEQLKTGFTGFVIGVAVSLVIGYQFYRKWSQPEPAIITKTEIREVQGKEIVKTQVVERVITKTVEGEKIEERIETNSTENEISVSEKLAHATVIRNYQPKSLLQVEKPIKSGDKDYILTYGRQFLWDSMYLTAAYDSREKLKDSFSMGVMVLF